MKIQKIIEATKGKLIIGNLEYECKNFVKDTRILKKEDTYIGIKGEKFDGNFLWKQAFENGASTVIVENINFENENISNLIDKNIILVKDTIKAIGDIARSIRKEKNIPVVGITGSVGKTSTKDIIANVVAQKYKTLKTEGNNNNHIGLPFTLFRLQDEEAAIIEMGMNHLGEIRYLTKIAKPTISVITNIGTSHIGNLGSRENILKAKTEILEGMDKKVLVINNDNDMLGEYYLKNIDNKDIEIHTYGIENTSEVMAEDIVLNDNGSEFICNLNGDKFKVKVPVGGIHFVYNALCAVTIGKLLELSNEQILKGIDTFELTKKRMDITELSNGVKIINDCYNASLESMQVSLKYLSSLNNERKIAVLGDILELGDFSTEIHKKVGKEVAKNNIDILICSGENSKFIAESAKQSGMNSEKIFYFENKELIEKFIKENWKKGDCILFKASNGMKFFEIVENLN